MNDEYHGHAAEPDWKAIAEKAMADAGVKGSELLSMTRKYEDARRYIDRINPGYTPEQKERAAKEAGLIDQTLMVREANGSLQPLDGPNIGYEAASPFVPRPEPTEPAPRPVEATDDRMRYPLPLLTASGEGAWMDVRFRYAMELLKAMASAGTTFAPGDGSIALAAAWKLFDEGEARGWIKPLDAGLVTPASEQAALVRGARAQAIGEVEMRRVIGELIPLDQAEVKHQARPNGRVQ